MCGSHIDAKETSAKSCTMVRLFDGGFNRHKPFQCSGNCQSTGFRSMEIHLPPHYLPVTCTQVKGRLLTHLTEAVNDVEEVEDIGHRVLLTKDEA